MISGHGGNIYELARSQGCDPSEITDMSSNVNPFGALPGVKSYLSEHLAVIETLPEVDAGAITRLFAEYNAVNPACVAPGNGSTQLLYALPRALGTRKALIVGPTYADYASACRQQGVTPDFLVSTAENDFRPDLNCLATLAAQFDTVFICNPNNPTGVMVPQAELAGLFAARPETMFVVDESYLPFAVDPQSAAPLYKDQPNVVRMTSLSKIFKVPGLRIGFAIASQDIIARLRDYAMPWSVNSLACAAVAHILANNELANRFIQETRVFLDDERRALTTRFQDHPGIGWFRSETSFLLAHLTGIQTAERVCAELAQQQILIRNCSNFEGLSRQYIRVSLKSRAENRRLGDCLADILGGC